MQNPCQVSLIENGQNQVLTIPAEFALPGKEVLLRRDGDRLIVEPVSSTSLLTVLKSLPDLTEEFPDIEEGLLPLDDITL
jgi:antitoxin VapB